MTTHKGKQLIESLGDKEYRETFVDENVSFGLGYQIRALREKHGWTQQELAKRTGKAQETISQLENPDYGRYTLKTLITLAAAFDVALAVNFVSFGEFAERLANLTPERIAPPSYEEERQMSFGEVPNNSGWVRAAVTTNSQ
jgi:transcriptional regulator with XRE-family HTH domain